MKAIVEAYKHLGQYIMEEVLDDDDNPIFKWCDIWNEQTEFKDQDSEDGEYPFDFPACFIDFDVPEATAIGIYEDELNTDITFYCAFETLADTHIGSHNESEGTLPLSIMVKLHEMLQGYADIKSGQLTRISAGRFNTNSNLIVYKMKYKTILRDHSPAEKRKALVTVVVDAELDITKRPHVNPGGNGSGEKWFDL
jgi:hypothetical protein